MSAGAIVSWVAIFIAVLLVYVLRRGDSIERRLIDSHETLRAILNEMHSQALVLRELRSGQQQDLQPGLKAIVERLDEIASRLSYIADQLEEDEGDPEDYEP